MQETQLLLLALIPQLPECLQRLQGVNQVIKRVAIRVAHPCNLKFPVSGSMRRPGEGKREDAFLSPDWTSLRFQFLPAEAGVRERLPSASSASQGWTCLHRCSSSWLGHSSKKCLYFPFLGDPGFAFEAFGFPSPLPLALKLS